MKCPSCGHDPMQPGRAENRRHEWFAGSTPWLVQPASATRNIAETFSILAVSMG